MSSISTDRRQSTSLTPLNALFPLIPIAKESLSKRLQTTDWSMQVQSSSKRLAHFTAHLFIQFTEGDFVYFNLSQRSQVQQCLSAYAGKILHIRSFSGLEEVIQTFNEFTRYLPYCAQWLDVGAHRLKSVHTLCKYLKQANFTAIIKKYAAYPDYLAVDTLRAYYHSTLIAPQDMKITLEQACTLLTLYSIFKEMPGQRIEIQPLFNKKGHVDQTAQEWIHQTLPPTGRAKGKTPFLNERTLKLFFETMKLQPKSEQLFFCFPTNQPLKQSQNIMEVAEEAHARMIAINQAIYNLGFNVFRQFEFNEQFYRMVPSASMMQCFLLAHAGDQAVRLKFRINISTLEDIKSNAMTKTRDMALPFIHVTLPKKADRMHARCFLDFLYHDFYHGMVASTVPNRYQCAFLEYANAIAQETAKHTYTNPKVSEFFEEYFERLIDMEHIYFQEYQIIQTPIPYSQITYGFKFIASLNYQQSDTITRLIYRQRYSLIGEIKAHKEFIQLLSVVNS